MGTNCHQSHRDLDQFMSGKVPLIFGVFCLTLVGGQADSITLAAAPQVTGISDLALVREVVEAHFAELKGYQPTDLIRRQDVEAIAEDLSSLQLGFTIPPDLAERVPADDSFLQQQFSGPKGQRFMRKVGAVDGGYAELEKLGTGPQGRGAARTVQAAKGGHELVEYMATTPHGKQLARQMSRVTGAKARPGAIYTKQDLLAALAELR